MTGLKLIQELESYSDLPSQLLKKELESLIAITGNSATELTLDDLRALVANYLQDVLCDAKDQYKRHHKGAFKKQG